MDTAHRLRGENVAEYILYLWQIEALLRALQFSPEAIYSQFVAPRKELSSEAQQTLLAWYVELGELLSKEEKEEKGHLEHTLHLIADLHNLHLQLQKVEIGARYRVLYTRLEEVLPDLRALIPSEQGETMSDTELSFRALYAAMLYRIKGEGGKNAVSDTIEYISPVIAELVKIYHQSEQGEVALFDD
ncbi:MAG: DUF4924 family protein [Rikenellaceae bacterium]